MKDVKTEVRRIERRMQKVEALNGLIGEAYVQKLRDAERLRNLATAVVESCVDAGPTSRRRAVDAEALARLSMFLHGLPRFAKGSPRSRARSTSKRR